jgi:hypothetical protein
MFIRLFIQINIIIIHINIIIRLIILINILLSLLWTKLHRIMKNENNIRISIHLFLININIIILFSVFYLDPVNDPWNESPVDNVDNARGGYSFVIILLLYYIGSKTHLIQQSILFG